MSRNMAQTAIVGRFSFAVNQSRMEFFFVCRELFEVDRLGWAGVMLTRVAKGNY